MKPHVADWTSVGGRKVVLVIVSDGIRSLSFSPIHLNGVSLHVIVAIDESSCYIDHLIIADRLSLE